MKQAWTPVLFGLLLTLAVILAYSNALDGPFILDDTYNIRDNPAIRALWPPWVSLNPPPGYVSFCTRPFINLTMCVDYALGGLDPRGYHLTNIAFHMAAVVVLFGLLSQIFRRLGLADVETVKWSFFCALIWALHPLATAAVNYPSQRGELAVGLFFFLMLYGLDRSEGARYPRAWLAGSVFSCLLGMGSKENMIAAPVLAVIYTRVFLSSSWKGLFRQRLLYYLALAATGIWPVYRHVLYSPHLGHAGLHADTWRHYLFTQAWGLNRMIRLILWPHPLVFDYGSLLIRSLAEVWVPALGLLVLLAITGWALVRHPPWGFAGLCFFSFLAPSVLFPAMGQTIAEHRMYAPLALAVVLFVMGLRHLSRFWKAPVAALPALLCLAALALGLLTRQRNAVYRSEIGLLTDSIARWPVNARAYYCRGVARFLEGDLAAALADYDRALDIMPHYVNCRLSRAALLVQQNRLEAALADLDQAASLEPTAHALAFRGYVLSRLKRYRDALENLEQAVQREPQQARAWDALAWLLATAEDSSVRDGARAVRSAEQAVRLQPGDPAHLDTLAAALAEAGRFEEAVVTAEEALCRARDQNHDPLAAKIGAHLDSLRQGTPLRD